MMTKNQSLEISVEELVLHGFSPHDRFHIGRALERELKSLFLTSGYADSINVHHDKQSLNAGNIRMTEMTNPAEIGRQIARSVYSSLNNHSLRPK